MTPMLRATTAVLLASTLAGCVVAPPARPAYPPAPVMSQPVPRAPGYGDDRHGERYYDHGRDSGGRQDWARAEVGRVQDIDLIRAENRTGGGGALLGAVIGAVVGRQLGSGSGRDAGTAVGAVGGAIIGNQIEKNNRGERDMYRIRIRLERGDIRIFDVETPGDLRPGDRVRVAGNQIQRW